MWLHCYVALRAALGLLKKSTYTVEPRYNKRLYNEVLGITNDFLYPNNSKIYEKEPRYNETSL